MKSIVNVCETSGWPSNEKLPRPCVARITSINYFFLRFKTGIFLRVFSWAAEGSAKQRFVVWRFYGVS